MIKNYPYTLLWNWLCFIRVTILITIFVTHSSRTLGLIPADRRQLHPVPSLPHCREGRQRSMAIFSTPSSRFHLSEKKFDSVTSVRTDSEKASWQSVHVLWRWKLDLQAGDRETQRWKREFWDSLLTLREAFKKKVWNFPYFPKPTHPSRLVWKKIKITWSKNYF